MSGYYVVQRRKKVKTIKIVSIIFVVLFSLSLLFIPSSKNVDKPSSYDMKCETVHAVTRNSIFSSFSLESEGLNIPNNAESAMRRCENSEVICYYMIETKDVFCNFKAKPENIDFLDRDFGASNIEEIKDLK